MEPRDRWWGDYDVPVGGGLHFLIGPLDLRVQRGPVEWRLGWHRGDDATLRRCVVGPLDEEVAPAGHEARRLAGSPGDGPLTVSVRLPERPFICRPEVTFAIVPGGSVTIYVSTPVTVVLEHGGPLAEVLAFRPSDTWLGATPRAGQLAYFTRTHAATSLENWTPNPSRAVSALRVRNLTATAVEMARVSLPVPNLGVYVDPQGGLHTEDVDVVFREVAGAVVPEVALLGTRPELTQIGAARTPPDRARLSRVLWGLFT